MDNNSNNSRNIIIALIVGVLIIAIAAIAYLAMNNEEAGDDTENNVSSSEQVQEEESQIDKITATPSEFIGESVTIEGEIDDVLSQRVFRVSEQPVGESILVVFPEALPEDRAQEAEKFLADNADARVTGKIRVAVMAEYERDYGLLFDDPSIEAEFKDKPVLVATSITFTDDSGSNFDYTFDFDVDATIDMDADI